MATNTDIREALRQVIDPELGVNIVDLGLVRRVEIDGPRVRVAMTMTSPTCPLGDYFKGLVSSAIRQHVPDAQAVDIVFEWEPPWDPAMMSEDARRTLDGDR